MSAVPEDLPSAPDVHVAPAAASAARRRVVAVSVDATELLRPASDLLRRVVDAHYVDVLLASELASVASTPLGLLGGAVPADPGGVGREDGPDEDRDDELDGTVAAAVARIDVPELHVHRLGLSGTTGPAAEDDLVAALSELVGFDPDPGVYLLGPAGTAAGRVAVQRAVQRVAQVYGLPVLSYRCHELTVVDPLA